MINTLTQNAGTLIYTGLSTDIKPSPTLNFGFIEMDSGKMYIADGASWLSAITKSSVGLGNVDNTSDLSKPISTATQAALDDIAPTGATKLTASAVQPVNPSIGDLWVNLT